MPRRSRLQGAPPQWSDVKLLLHMRIKDAAAELNVPTTYLRYLCRQNKYTQWPGKKIRYQNRTGKKVMQEVDPRDGSPSAGLAAGPSQVSKTLAGPSQVSKTSAGPSQVSKTSAGPSQVSKTVETKEGDDMTRIHAPAANPPPGEGIYAPVANHPPVKELVTLNLIDKVGLPSSSEPY